MAACALEVCDRLQTDLNKLYCFARSEDANELETGRRARWKYAIACRQISNLHCFA